MTIARPRRVQQLLNNGLERLLADDPRAMVIGEDVVDPYGGAFKVTRGLSTAYPDRVLSTPISEAGIVGLGIGLALGGFRPVVEIMFGDFVTLAVDQVVNQASKIVSMYNERVDLPLTVRTPMGGRRGYGPTHSQTLERLFFGLPGVDVYAASNLCDPGGMLYGVASGAANLSLFIENKLLYALPLLTDGQLMSMRLTATVTDGVAPTWTLSHSASPDVTLAAYGGMVPLALEAAAILLEREGLHCDLVVPHRISPLDADPLLASLRASRRLVVAEESATPWGWGAEVVAACSSVRLDAPPQRVGARLSPIPARRDREDRVLPQVEDIVAAAVATVDVDYA